MDPKPDVGDVLFTRGDSVLNKLSLWAPRRRGEDETLASHQGTFYDEKDVIEATFQGVVETEWIPYRRRMDDADKQWCIFGRVEPFTHNERVALWQYLSQSIGWKYSKAELVLCLLDGMLGKITGKEMIVFRRIDLFRERVICSKTSNRPFVKMREFPRQAYYWSPDDTYDYLSVSLEWSVRSASPDWPLT